MKTMLISGASKGIGLACAENFKDSYNVITVARTGNMTENGDITDKEFVDFLVAKYGIDILINNAGVFAQNYHDNMNINAIGAGYLLMQFYHKMQNGHIINISSAGANLNGWQGITNSQMMYYTSKASTQHLVKLLQDSKKNNVKITNLEPSIVNTTFGNSELKHYHEDEYNEQTKPKIPLRPQDVVDTIDWILNLPSHMHISNMEIRNFHKVKF